MVDVEVVDCSRCAELEAELAAAKWAAKKVQILTQCLERIKERARPAGYDSGDSGIMAVIEAAEKELE